MLRGRGFGGLPRALLHNNAYPGRPSQKKYIICRLVLVLLNKTLIKDFVVIQLLAFLKTTLPRIVQLTAVLRVE